MPKFNLKKLFKNNSTGYDMKGWLELADFLALDKETNKDVRSEATYFACLKIISESIGKLPLKLYNKTKKQGVIEAFTIHFIML